MKASKALEVLLTSYIAISAVMVCSLVGFNIVDITYKGNELLWIAIGLPAAMSVGWFGLLIFPKTRKAYLDSLMIFLLGKYSWQKALAVAIVSGVGEEVLFRGFLQERIGLVAASIAFGLMHFNKNIKLYVVVTTALGLVLGGLTILSGSLLPAITVHVVNNFVGFRYAKWHWAKRLAELDTELSSYTKEALLRGEYATARLSDPEEATA